MLGKYCVVAAHLLLSCTVMGAEYPAEKPATQTTRITNKLFISFTAAITGEVNNLTAVLVSLSSRNKEIIKVFIDIDHLSNLNIYASGRNEVRKFMAGTLPEKTESIDFSFIVNAPDNQLLIRYSDSLFVFTNAAIIPGEKYTIAILPLPDKENDRQGQQSIRAASVEITGDLGEGGGYTEIFLLLTLVVADILIFVIIHYRNRHLKKRKSKNRSGVVTMKNVELAKPEIVRRSTVTLFGAFRVYNTDGKEVSKSFSPILKELFLLILLSEPEFGITSARMRETLWYDKSEESARNNRSVYITRLRQILETIGDHEISSISGTWKIDMKEISVDYLEFRSLIELDTISEEDIIKLLAIIRHGNLLPDSTYSWLDDIKARTADNAITILTSYAEQVNTANRPDLLSLIADALFVLDPVNDLALSYKCKHYNQVGKAWLAKQLYASFIKDYKSLYGEEYTKSYSDIILEDPV